MNQEKVGKIIKDLRKKSGLSQQKFAEKYGVTYQAVSKWENGKNIPDILILQQICNDYNISLNELLENNVNKKKGKFFVLIVLVLIIILGIIGLWWHNKENHFEFKTISASCDNFELFGSIAYNKNKTSIYITNITYCGGNDQEVYKKIDCALYENSDNSNNKITNCSFGKNENVSLEDFLKNVNFNVDNYDNTCENYRDNSLFLEINAMQDNGMIVTYKVPLKLMDNCR